MQEKESKDNKHFWISIVKSVVRILAGASLFQGEIKGAAILLIFAESLGILEEIV